MTKDNSHLSLLRTGVATVSDECADLDSFKNITRENEIEKWREKTWKLAERGFGRSLCRRARMGGWMRDG